MLLGILLTIHILVAILLIGVVLLQRSEGGALGMGGGPSGFMTARGAGDLLTRTTWVLAAIFFGLSLLLTMLAGREHGATSVVDRVKIDAIDPSKLNQPASPAAAAPAQNGGEAPIEAPTPQVRNPLLDEGGGSDSAPAKP